MITLRHKKSAAVQQRFASVYSSKKATYTFGWLAVAFLMLSFLSFMYLSLNFPFVSPPIILEALKMFPFWRKANRLPFWQHLCLLYSIRECFPMNFCGMGIQNLRYRNWLFLQNKFLYIFTKGQITDIFRLFRAKRFLRRKSNLERDGCFFLKNEIMGYPLPTESSPDICQHRQPFPGFYNLCL